MKRTDSDAGAGDVSIADELSESDEALVPVHGGKCDCPCDFWEFVNCETHCCKEGHHDVHECVQ